MLKHLRFALAVPLLCLFSSVAYGQTPTAETPLNRFLSHVDVGLLGTGVFTKSVTGTSKTGIVGLQQDASNTFGGLFTLRVTKSPYMGFEFNGGYQRFTETYSCCNLQGGAQANAIEYTFGYVAHPPHEILGAKPFLSAGAGTLAFRPTPNGGQGLLTQARMTYYYSVGVDYPVNDHFAIRAGFRQHFYLAPDFGQNFITMKQRTITSQPEIGFILHF